MATFREVIYMVLDLLKERSDDAYYTEEHIMFLASKMRAYLLERKYKQTRNSTFVAPSEANNQLLQLALEPTTILPAGCTGVWLKSTARIPELLGVSEPKFTFPNGLIHFIVTYVPLERMPYVGTSRWLRNIIYATRSEGGYLYLKGGNPQFAYLRRIAMSGIFASANEAAELTCEMCRAEGGICDPLDAEFPLEESLIPSCIEMIVQELTGSRYAPEDKNNNAKDDFSEAGVVQKRSARPAEDASGNK